jgi:hypothetical protein
MVWVDVELVDEVVVQDQQAHDRVLHGNPCLAKGHGDIGDVRPDSIIAVNRRRDCRDRPFLDRSNTSAADAAFFASARMISMTQAFPATPYRATGYGTPPARRGQRWWQGTPTDAEVVGRSTISSAVERQRTH